MRRWLAAAAALAVFVASLALLFPIDLIVRRAVARATPPGWPAMVFRAARLRPSGVLLDDVTLRDATGRALAHFGWLRLRPSIWSLARGAGGLPLTIEADACGGTGEATVSAAGPITEVAVAWRDADLAACPPLDVAGGALAGHAGGAARLRFAGGAPPVGAGDVELTSASWRGLGLLAVLSADSAHVHWTLRAGVLVLEAIDLRSPDVAVTGRGEVRLADPVPESGLDLHLALRAGGPLRRVSVGGTLARPDVDVQ